MSARWATSGRPLAASRAMCARGPRWGSPPGAAGRAGAGGAGRGRRVPLDDFLEALTLDELHGEVDAVAVAERPEVHDVDDVRVVDRRGRPRLAQEALDRLLVAGEALVEHL